jgi:hypothetical protein
MTGHLPRRVKKDWPVRDLKEGMFRDVQPGHLLRIPADLVDAARASRLDLPVVSEECPGKLAEDVPQWFSERDIILPGQPDHKAGAPTMIPRDLVIVAIAVGAAVGTRGQMGKRLWHVFFESR